MGQLVKAHENSEVVKLLKLIVTLKLVVTQNNCSTIDSKDFHCSSLMTVWKRRPFEPSVSLSSEHEKQALHLVNCLRIAF